METKTELIFLDHEDPELEYAFSKFTDKEMYNKQFGEYLQYMGTSVQLDKGIITHEFRHRALPGTNQRKYWQIAATDLFKAKVKQGCYKFF